LDDASGLTLSGNQTDPVHIMMIRAIGHRDGSLSTMSRLVVSHDASVPVTSTAPGRRLRRRATGTGKPPAHAAAAALARNRRSGAAAQTRTTVIVTGRMCRRLDSLGPGTVTTPVTRPGPARRDSDSTESEAPYWHCRASSPSLRLRAQSEPDTESPGRASGLHTGSHDHRDPFEY
jgi:hypothetical protein